VEILQDVLLGFLSYLHVIQVQVLEYVFQLVRGLPVKIYALMGGKIVNAGLVGKSFVR
jgi:hypothetical protein